jgi:sugar phosphate isomerase/epimerase
MENSRRKFFKTLGAVAALSATQKVIGMPAIIQNLYAPSSLIRGVQVGAITYSFREMADQSAEAVLEYVRSCGISAIELMGDPAEAFAGGPKSTIDFRVMSNIFRKRQAKQELSSDEQKQLVAFMKEREAIGIQRTEWRKTADMKDFEKLRKMYKKAGVSIYAFKPDAFSVRNLDSDIHFGMRAAKALGAQSVTLEHPADDAHTLKLGKIAETYGLKVGYHGHEQQTFGFWDTALSQSPANSLNLDLGHFVAAGNPNPLDIITQKHANISSMHIKDRQSKANGGANLVWGSGDTPIKEALVMMRDQKYKFPATIELEYKIPEGSDSVKEVKKCVDLCRTMLEA